MRVMTEKVQQAFEKANEGRPDGTPTICGHYGRACRQMGTKPSHMPCLSCPLAKYLEGGKPQRIIPEEGVVYENRNGWRYLCTAAPEPDGPDQGAVMQRVKDGWTLKAHNVYQCPDGTIEWGFSTDGHWEV